MLEAIEKGLGMEQEGKAKDKTAEADPKAKPEAAKPGEKKDESLEMPQGLTLRAQERFQSLANRIRESEHKLGEVTQELNTHRVYSDTFTGFVRDTGVNPEQFKQIAIYCKAANSGDINTELQFLTGRLREIQMQTGKTFDLTSQTDPLTNFPELLEKVSTFQMTREDALELARGRMNESQNQQVQQSQQHQQQEAQNWIKAKDNSINIIKNWELTAQKDPDYARIAPLVMSNKEALDWIVKNTAPNTWQTHLNMLYTQTKAAVSANPQTRSEPPRPLSGSGGRPNNAGKVAGNMFDAMFPNG